jgi:hypothetical protein
MTHLAVQFVTVPAWPEACLGKGILDEVGGRIQLCVTKHVPLADVASKRLHIGA